jgi:hypothetical protein
VIDSLDVLKKGNQKQNANAREAIRFLDQQFQRLQHSAIRPQKVTEKLTRWASAEEYLITSSKNQPSLTRNEHSSSFHINNCHRKCASDSGVLIDESAIHGSAYETFTVWDIPKEFRQILNACLYYTYVKNLPGFALVTTNEALTSFANMFAISVMQVDKIE